ncbi:hypothetical protein MTO96_045257 [Rhipicephalus appendiculatus]
MFLNIVGDCEPQLKASVTVFEDLKISTCFEGARIRRLGESVVPDTVNDINVLIKILEDVGMLRNQEQSRCLLLDRMISLLDKVEATFLGHLQNATRLSGKEVHHFSSVIMTVLFKEDPLAE